ncbi:MAG TPA: hypothetical protein DCR04_03580 [Flavobacteriales bacterium]|nr:hypothetical protein [Flavobacteriales bacterium]
MKAVHSNNGRLFCILKRDLLGSDKNNWSYDRNRRSRLFNVLKRSSSPTKKAKSTVDNTNTESFPRKTKYDWVAPVFGAILKIAVFILIFYSFAMIISYGKRWP